MGIYSYQQSNNAGWSERNNEDVGTLTGLHERDADRTMIIGLSGLKQSGKDTIAAYLVKEHGFERKAFADPLKQSVAALFDIPFSVVDKYKLDDLCTVNIEAGFGAFHDMTFRTFLQRYGTESHRDVFGQDFWVDLTLPVQGFYPGRAIVVTDVRFREEAERVKFLGGRIIYVQRDEAALVNKDQHRSEDIDFANLIDGSISNNGTLE